VPSVVTSVADEDFGQVVFPGRCFSDDTNHDPKKQGLPTFAPNNSAIAPGRPWAGVCVCGQAKCPGELNSTNTHDEDFCSETAK
jgi:hypothetical protein